MSSINTQENIPRNIIDYSLFQKLGKNLFDENKDDEMISFFLSLSLSLKNTLFAQLKNTFTLELPRLQNNQEIIKKDDNLIFPPTPHFKTEKRG